jgi:TolB-like protein
MDSSQVAFGPFILDRSRMTLLRDGNSIAIGQRGYALLDALLLADEVIGKNALMEAGCPGTIVEEGNLAVQISALRKAMGPRDDGGDWIVTVPRVGYRLVRGPAKPPDAPRPPTLAVLPFENLGDDPQQDYFADGMVDELISVLSRFRSFAVIARGSSFAWKGRRADVRQIARELGVRYVLEGSVRRAGGRLRLAVQLADGGDGTNLWMQTFEGSVDEAFEFQDRISASVAAVIEPRLQQAELELSRRDRPGSMTAYDLYLRSVAQIYAFTEEANAEAIRLLEQAITIEPENGVYLGFLAWALEHRSSMCWPSFGPDDRRRCLQCAHEAVERAGNDATILAHCAVAMQLAGGEYEAGVMVARAAVELNPLNVVALLNAGIAELVGGDLDRAMALLQRALEIQPIGAYETMNGIGNVHMARGDYEQGLAWARQAHTLNRRYIPIYWSLVTGSVMVGRMDEARAALAELLVLAPGLTVEAFASSSRTLDRSRDEMMVEAMRRAGLPER